MPSYSVISREEQVFVENGLTVNGKLVSVRLIPDTQLSMEYVVEEVDEQTGKKINVTKIKDDFIEVQAIFVQENEEEDIVLSRAAWNHEDGVAALKEKIDSVDATPIEEVVKEAMPREDI